MRVRWGAQQPKRIDAKSQFSSSHKESSKLIKNSVIVCRTLLDSYLLDCRALTLLEGILDFS